MLDEEGMVYDVERKRVRKNSEERIFTHIHVQDTYPVELTVYAIDMSHYVFKSSITGKAIERASIAELEQMLTELYPDLDLESAMLDIEEQAVVTNRLRITPSFVGSTKSSSSARTLIEKKTGPAASLITGRAAARSPSTPWCGRPTGLLPTALRSANW